MVSVATLRSLTVTSPSPPKRVDHRLRPAPPGPRRRPSARPCGAAEQPAGGIAAALSISRARQPARCATSTSRRELDEFAEPTTRIRSQSARQRADGVLAVLGRVTDVARGGPTTSGKRSCSALDDLRGLVDRQRRLGQVGDRAGSATSTSATSPASAITWMRSGASP